MPKTKSKWAIVVFEGEYRQFDGEVAYVKGPFETYEDAIEWANNSKDCPKDEWQITFIEDKDRED